WPGARATAARAADGAAALARSRSNHLLLTGAGVDLTLVHQVADQREDLLLRLDDFAERRRTERVALLAHHVGGALAQVAEHARLDARRRGAHRQREHPRVDLA